MSKIDEKVERIQAMPLEEAIELMMRCDQVVRETYENNPKHLKGAIWERAIAVRAVQGMGVTVVTRPNGNIVSYHLPVIGYLKDALKEREAVSIPEVGEVKGHGYYDPIDQALMASGRLKDV